MIGITTSGEAYRATAHALPLGFVAETEITDCAYRIWLPQSVVERLEAVRDPEESFSDVILRLTKRGSFAAMTR